GSRTSKAGQSAGRAGRGAGAGGKTGERFWEAEIYRLRGELLLTVEGAELARGVVEGMPDAESPEGCFLTAVEIARRQQGKSLELRTTVSLARLWRQQGKRSQPGTCWETSTAGSLRDSTPLICNRQKHCWESFQRKAEKPMASTLFYTVHWRKLTINSAIGGGQTRFLATQNRPTRWQHRAG